MARGWTTLTGKWRKTQRTVPVARTAGRRRSAWAQYGHWKSPYSTSVIGALSGPREWSSALTGTVRSLSELTTLLETHRDQRRRDHRRSLLRGPTRPRR